MLTLDQAQQILDGGNVVDTNGSKIGTVGQVFLDDRTGEPEWVTVKTGLFGGAESFVPLASAAVKGKDVEVPFDKDKIKGAPRVKDSDGHLDQSEEAELFRYYGYDTNGRKGSDSDGRDVGGDDVTDDGSNLREDASVQDASRRGAGHDTSGPDTDNAMTRSEERLHVGTERVASGKARLRKYVVTENVTKTVPVSHEEVRIEREPITEANRGDAMSGGEITAEEHEVELSEERVVVSKESVPVERVRMDVDTVTGEEQVTEEVRKEQIEADDATANEPDSRSGRSS